MKLISYKQLQTQKYIKPYTSFFLLTLVRRMLRSSSEISSLSSKIRVMIDRICLNTTTEWGYLVIKQDKVKIMISDEK